MSNAAPRPSARLGRRDVLVLGALVLGAMALNTGWQQYRANAAGPAVAALARPGDIRLVSSLTCLYCTRAREWFTLHQVPFTECFIERDEACNNQFRALMAPGTPLLVVRGQTQIGFSPDRVRDALEPGA